MATNSSNVKSLIETEVIDNKTVVYLTLKNTKFIYNNNDYFINDLNNSYTSYDSSTSKFISFISIEFDMSNDNNYVASDDNSYIKAYFIDKIVNDGKFKELDTNDYTNFNDYILDNENYKNNHYSFYNITSNYSNNNNNPVLSIGFSSTEGYVIIPKEEKIRLFSLPSNISVNSIYSVTFSLDNNVISSNELNANADNNTYNTDNIFELIKNQTSSIPTTTPKPTTTTTTPKPTTTTTTPKPTTTTTTPKPTTTTTTPKPTTTTTTPKPTTTTTTPKPTTTTTTPKPTTTTTTPKPTTTTTTPKPTTTTTTPKPTTTPIQTSTSLSYAPTSSSTTTIKSFDSLFNDVSLSDNYINMLKSILILDDNTVDLTNNTIKNYDTTGANFDHRKNPIFKYPYTKNDFIQKIYINLNSEYYNNTNEEKLLMAITYVGSDSFKSTIINRQLNVNLVDFIKNINDYISIFNSISNITNLTKFNNTKYYTKYQISYIVGFIFNTSRGMLSQTLPLKPIYTKIIYNGKYIDNTLTSLFNDLKDSNELLTKIYNILFLYMETNSINASFKPFNVLYTYLSESEIDNLLEIVKNNYTNIDDDFKSSLNKSLIKKTRGSINFTKIKNNNRYSLSNNNNNDIIYDYNGILRNLNSKNLIESVDYDSGTNTYTVTLKSNQFSNIDRFTTTSSYSLDIDFLSSDATLEIDSTGVDITLVENAISDSSYTLGNNQTSTSQQTTSTPQQTTSTPQQTTSTPQQTTSTPQQTTSTPQQTTSTPQQTTSTPPITIDFSRMTTLNTNTYEQIKVNKTEKILKASLFENKNILVSSINEYIRDNRYVYIDRGQNKIYIITDNGFSNVSGTKVNSINLNDINDNTVIIFLVPKNDSNEINLISNISDKYNNLQKMKNSDFILGLYINSGIIILIIMLIIILIKNSKLKK
jgi:hypothetical protein